MRTLTLTEAACALRKGEPVVLPTDTVYGVGVAVGAAKSPHKLFEAKGRPANKPVAWLVEGPQALDAYGIDISPAARAFAEAFWPGALTLVVCASTLVPPAFQSEAGTIGLRMPADKDALALIGAVEAPLAVTSANLSGKPAPAFFEALDERLVAATAGVFVPDGAQIQVSRNPQGVDFDALLTDTECVFRKGASPAIGSSVSARVSVAQASTVVDCTENEPRILREGALPWAVLKGALA